MRKREFLYELKRNLSSLPKQEVEERVNFYGEMIDDRIEEGCEEEAAVAAIGTVDEICAQIIDDIPLLSIAKERIKPKRQLKSWEILLLALGSPIWLSLIISVAAVIISLYAVLWSLLISVWAVFISLTACVPACAVCGVLFTVGGNALSGIFMIGTGAFCTGLAVILFFACKRATAGTVSLTGKIAFGIKKFLSKKENRNE